MADDDAERQYTPESICALVAAAENVRVIWHALGHEDRHRVPFIGSVVSDLVIAYEHLESISQGATIAAKDAEIAALKKRLEIAEWIASITDEGKEIAALCAEIARLREAIDVAESALSRISALEITGSGAVVSATHALCLLREALTPPQEPQG